MSYKFNFLFVYFLQAICGMFFLESICRSSDLYGAHHFQGFSTCGRDDRALCTSRRVNSLVAWICEGWIAFRVCLALLRCFFRPKMVNFRFLHFFRIFLLFHGPACSSAVCVRICVWKSLVPGSASVLNAFWQGWIVVACFCDLRAPNSGFLIFPVL